MHFACSLSEVDVDPVSWSRQREDEGWDALFVSDHLWTCAGDERTRRIASMFPEGSLFGRFYGPPGQVAEAVLALAKLGLQRVHLTPGDQQSLANLAPLLCHTAVTGARP